MTLCQLVKELKGIPLYNLGSSLQEKIKCHPNYNSFDIWKGDFFLSSLYLTPLYSSVLLSNCWIPSSQGPFGLYPREDHKIEY